MLAAAPATAFGPDQGVQSQVPAVPPSRVVATVDTFFADPGRYAPPCEELQLFYQPQVNRAIPETDRPAFMALRRQFLDARPELDRLRLAAAEADRAMQLAASDVFRKLEATRVGLVKLGTDGPGLETLWNSATRLYALDQAEERAIDATLGYLVALWNLQSAEDGIRATATTYYETYARLYQLLDQAEERAIDATLGYLVALWNLQSAEDDTRTAATTYYETYARLYQLLDRAEREKILGWFAGRTGCIDIRRRELFASMIGDTGTFWALIAARSAGVLSDSRTSESDDAAGSSFVTRSLDGLADATVRDVLRQREYAWLASETSTNAAIYSALLASEELAIQRQELHSGAIRAYFANPRLDPDDPLPADASDRAWRQQILQHRAMRGALALGRERLGLEATYRRSTSVATGMAQLFQDALRLLRVTATGLAGNDWMQGAEANLKALGILAISHKLLSESFALLVTGPLKDAFTEYALKPAVGLFGGEVKTATDKARDEYRKGLALIAPKYDLMFDMWGGAVDFDAAARFAKGMRGADPAAGGLGDADVVRGLLEDASFIAATGGGLAWIVEPACADPADRTALLVRAARYALEANTRAAVIRVAATRGLTAEPSGGLVTHQSLDAIFRPAGVPGTMTDAALLAADRALSVMPVIGGLRDLVNLPQTVRNGIRYLQGNIQTQDDYLKLRVDLQQQLLFVLNALEVCDYDYACVASRWPDVYRDHVSLLNRSPEYIEAFRRVQDGRFEREKLVTTARYLDRTTGHMTSEGRGALAGIQQSQDMENADLQWRSAMMSLVFHAITVNNMAVADQARALLAVEAQYRAAFAIRGPPTDFTSVAVAFEAEQALNELVTIYEGLYQTAVKDMIVSVATQGLVDHVMARQLEATGIDFVVKETASTAGETLFGKLNPWVPMFSQQGIYNTFKGAFEDSIKNGLAQLVSQRLTSISEAQAETAIDLVLTVISDTEEETRRRTREGDPVWALDRLSDQEREAAVDGISRELEAFYKAEVWPRRALLLADDEGPQADAARLRLLQELQTLENSDRIRFLRNSLQTAIGDAPEVIERRFRAEEEAERTAARTAASLLEARARDRMRDAEPGSEAADAAARQADVAHLVQRLSGDDVRVRDLERLVAADDPLALRGRLLNEGLDIKMIRHALKAAKANDPESVARVTEIAVEIDDLRIGVVNRLLADFMATSEWGRQVVTVIQGGAAKGNPEYQGIFGDIDFTVFTLEGVDGTKLKRALLDYFTEHGFPLAEEQGGSKIEGFIDTEAFVQPWGRFMSSEEPFGEVLYDVGTKRHDPTRFYSEAGAKWFLNNVAYSGKVLWGDESRSSGWTEIQPGEAYGLALDMSRYLGFLTAPDYTRAAVEALPPEARLDRLSTVLKNSKYFIRLIDAYLISHQGFGNSQYNNDRLGRRTDDGSDASYHYQILRDVENMVAAADRGDPELAARARSILGTEDVEMVRLMAEMKMKGVNPDPWEVLPGANPTEKSARALEMVEWMRTTSARILAETSSVWRESFERAMTEGSPEARQLARADAHRIGTILTNIHEKDSFGASALMRPPVVVEEGESGPRYRAMTQAEHQAAIEADMQHAETIRGRLNAGKSRALAAVRADYPAERLLSEADRQQMALRIKQAYDAIDGRIENADEIRLSPWARFWLSR